MRSLKSMIKKGRMYYYNDYKKEPMPFKYENAARIATQVTKDNPMFSTFTEKHSVVIELKGSEYPVLTWELIDQLVKKYTVGVGYNLGAETRLKEDHGIDEDMHIIRFNWTVKSR